MRKRRERAGAWIRGIVVAEDDGISPAMIVSIEVFINSSAFALDELLEIKYGSIPEFYRAGYKGDIAVFLSVVSK